MDESPGSTEPVLFASTAHQMTNAISVRDGTLENLLRDASPASGKAVPQRFLSVLTLP